MPSEKRARKRAAREAKLAELERQRKRQSAVRRGITIAVVAAAAVGIYFAVKGGSSGPKNAARSTKATTSSHSTTTVTAGSTSGDTQAAANAVAVAAGCPPSPTTQLASQQYPSAPAMTIDTSKTYLATVKTDLGTFVITLNATEAPKTVNNFVFLAQHNYYHCVIFHRVIPGFMDQTGDRTGTGSGGPGYTFADELPAKATPQYPIGSVAMANSGPNTNGSQFFIVTGSEGESLPPSYSLFGTVTSGMSVVQAINADGNASPSANGVPPKVIHRMLSVTISSS